MNWVLAGVAAVALFAWSSTSTSSAAADAFYGQVLDVMDDLSDQGLTPMLWDLCRTEAEQAEYVAAGTSWTMDSQHLACLAADVVDGRRDPAGDLVLWGAPMDPSNGYDAVRVSMFAEHAAALYVAATSRGLISGADWASPKYDPAHIEAA